MNNLFNEYGRKARLFPALLCVIPFLVLKHFLIDPHLDLSFTDTLFTKIAGDISLSTVLMYLLAQVNRLVSKLIFEDKTKFPTTQMLLSSSPEMSAELRSRIDQRIRNDFKLSLPTSTEEELSIDNAKTRIKEIVHLIINKVGNGTLLLQHNIEYGFARNLIGGSLFAFIVAFSCSIVFSSAFKNETAFIISAVLSVIYLIPIIFSRIILNHHSKEYARILFREYLGS